MSVVENKAKRGTKTGRAALFQGKTEKSSVQK